MYTLQELCNRMDKNGLPMKIIETQSKIQGFAPNLQRVPMSHPGYHAVTQAANLPAAAYSRYNRGYALSSVGTVTIREKSARFELATSIEQELAEATANPEMYRFQNVLRLNQGLNATIESKLFYEQVAIEQDGFDGLHIRYSDPTSPAGNQLINAAGTSSGQLTSIFLVKTGEGGVRVTYPDNGNAGIKHIVKPPRAVEVDDNGTTRVKWMLDDVIMQDAGLAIDDWRSVAHIANIDIADIFKNPGVAGRIDLVSLMAQAEDKVSRSEATGNAFWVMPEIVKTALRKQAKADVSAGGGLVYENYEGMRIEHFGAKPIFVSDAILTNLTTISF